MKRIYNILILAIALLPGCGKHHATPDESDTKIPIDFSAISNTTEVKSTTPLSSIHEDFGVWGIARHYDASISPYLLWDADLERVTKTDQYYQPENPAFWVLGYTYNFLALAPFTDLDAEVRPERATATTKDKLVFKYDLGKKYVKSNYAFDLMGAAATSTVNAAHDRGAQDLTFWHLFTTINIKVTFSGTTGSVSGMRLHNVDSDADYTISFDDEPGNGETRDTDYPLDITYDAAAGGKSLKTISFDSEMPDDGYVIRILPQNISDFDLYLDFTVKQQNQDVPTENFKINLSNAKVNPIYSHNKWYNWNINISPKTIEFDVTVDEWTDGDEFEFPIE